MSVQVKEGVSPSGAVKVTAKKHKWYLGGIASAMAACCTHPLDLLKVHLQTQQQVTQRLSSMAIHVVRTQGAFALYNGLSASVMRQLTYSTTRYGLYEVVSAELRKGNEPLPFYQKVVIGSVSGFLGGIVGNPADMVNVRMQNDVKTLDKALRRNYKHVFDGLYRTATEEGVSTWMKGVTMTSSRALLMTVAQVACYDQAKQLLLASGYFKDNVIAHFTASFIAGTIATGITQPVDVMKTRLMEAKPGQYKSVVHCILFTARLGPMGFYKGFIPAWVRLAPHTIITWIFLEQLRLLFPVKQTQ
ncbi:mitochondrial dicarboxylate carrier-like [Stylophora pistillata]|uniref:Mitochondrial dicarboxylate carrier n=1 Tax=Stylophora pistillata TaxID=50429 RepID=A0A2B4RUH6_STYPI|nr:mitochondrial dicarboxylate carrier-like [Stylophora pistillata]PFX20210.1 Mitochondrial dicarboxylate carrier [Stylophora pistillata]